MALLSARELSRSARANDRIEGPSITIADSIETIQIGEIWDDLLGRTAATFSRDRTQFVVITRKGNITNNTNDYSLLRFVLNGQAQLPTAELLLTVPSASNRAGIDDLRWVNDHIVSFLISEGTSARQVASFDVRARSLVQLTSHATDVMGFDISAATGDVCFAARPPRREFWTHETIRDGLVISDQYVGDVLAGHTWEDDEDGSLYPYELYWQRQNEASVRIDTGDYGLTPAGLAISPNGQFAVVCAWVRKEAVAERWAPFKTALAPDMATAIYLLVDGSRRSVRPLYDAPVASLYPRNMVWTSNSTILIADTYLPASETKGMNPQQRFVVEADVISGKITRIVEGRHRLVEWQSDERSVVLAAEQSGPPFDVRRELRNEKVFELKKSGEQWTTIRAGRRSATHPVTVSLDQDLNRSPLLVLKTASAPRGSVILDPNPQLRRFRLGRVQEIQWGSVDGHSIIGGLYWPTSYVKGQTYPLIIQTHGWFPGKFALEGPSTAGYAAQALAARGFFVAQLPDCELWEGNADEATRYMRMHELAIDYLNDRGLINTARVGIMGWSRTGYHVRHTLTFSRKTFAAASIADGLDASYGQYLSYLNLGHDAVRFYEAVNGGTPFGSGLREWAKRATGFNLDKVNTPTRLLAFIPSVVLNSWEWFAALRYQRKPVELVWVHRGAHAPVLPTHRLVAQEGNVDWFDFWINGHEDDSPRKKEQYRRWRKLQTDWTADS